MLHLKLCTIFKCVCCLLNISGNLWQFKRDKVPTDNADLAVDDSQSFKYKAALVGKAADAVNNKNSSVKDTLKYLSNFWRY